MKSLENWVGREVKVKEGIGFEHLNIYKLVVEGVVDEKYPLTVKIGDIDSYEWFDEEELNLV